MITFGLGVFLFFGVVFSLLKIVDIVLAGGLNFLADRINDAVERGKQLPPRNNPPRPVKRRLSWSESMADAKRKGREAGLRHRRKLGI